MSGMKVWRFPLVPKQDEHSTWSDGDDVAEGDVVSQAQQGQVCDIEIPAGATILPTVQLSSKGLTLYALVNPDAEKETRSFFVCSNGVELPDGVYPESYRGTFKVHGSLTAHVFELVPVTA